MSLIVAKFGGTSVANIRRIERCIPIIKKLTQNYRVVIVVSAMAGVTNRLQHYVDDFKESTYHHALVLSSGEQIAAGLMALALEKQGIPSQTFLGWQVPIITNDTPTDASIVDIPISEIQKTLDNTIIPIVAGFQGITKDKRITTLGRGGSDTTAVYLAHYLKAKECQIYSDVDGVYSSDPNIISSAKRLDSMTYNEMFLLSRYGAKVLQVDAAQKAMEKQVNLRLLSSFIESQGTLLTSDIKDSARFASLCVKDHEAFIIGKNITHLKIPDFQNNIISNDVIKIDTRLEDPKKVHDILLKI